MDVSPAMEVPSTADSHACVQAASLLCCQLWLQICFQHPLLRPWAKPETQRDKDPTECKLRWLAMAAATLFPEAAVTVFMVSSANLGVRAHQCCSKTFPRMARQGLLYPRLALSYVSSWRWPCPGEPLYLVYTVLWEEPRTSYILGKHSSNWIPSSQIGSTLWFWSVTGYLFSKCKVLPINLVRIAQGVFSFTQGRLLNKLLGTDSGWPGSGLSNHLEFLSLPTSLFNVWVFPSALVSKRLF